MAKVRSHKLLQEPPMGHPLRNEAMQTSKSKMRAITGSGGGGHAFIGGSGFKKANDQGVQKSYDPHTKSFGGDHPVGKKSKPRADKFSRGGRTKKKGDVNIAIMMPHGGQRPGAGAPPARPPMPAGPPPGGPPMGAP